MKGSFRQNEDLCRPERVLFGPKQTFEATTGTSWTEKDVLGFQADETNAIRPTEGPSRQKEGFCQLDRALYRLERAR